MAAMVPEKIRNVALLGAPGGGKTSLGDTMLWLAGAVSRRGSVDQGNSVFDHEEEAKSRHHSVSLSLGHCLWNNHWLNLCLLYTSPSPRDRTRSRMPSSA